MTRTSARLLAAAATLLTWGAHAQALDAPNCAGMADDSQRLACYDRWSASRTTPVAPATIPATIPAVPAPVVPAAAGGGGGGLRFTEKEGCHDLAYSELSRFWELEPGADCGTFGLRVFHPMSADVVHANTVNREPTSGNPLNNATTSQDFRTTEVRLQVSVRTKIAQNLLLRNRPDASDSLWFAYTQQSYWQIFTADLSRPFRSTDHEPEFIYVLPLQSADPSQWRVRFGGLGVVHQSNGQSLPLSRSWNRVYLMGGAEKGRLQVQARVWQRLHENPATDDNPDISDFIGRGEARVIWHQNRANLLAVTGRSSLHSNSRGSVRLEWFRTLGNQDVHPTGGLQLHTQLFTGYGDTLLDFNRRRTVFSVGLSLVDW
ncbi:phospholipase A [Ramlibacter sp.]|uniref:phospholipase A n=1 Tax=Ramlibacter sp. TaxID=1917967 RepID=UPI0026044D5C|nr:phospholipase A [Ramlibacter sp.]MDB5954272.1 Phospholipase [Ramlibacter sp.]